MNDSKKTSVVIQRVKQPIKIMSQQLNQVMRQVKIADRLTPSQNDSMGSATQFNKTTNRQSITPTLKLQKDRPLLPKSSQMSTVTSSVLNQMQGQIQDILSHSPTQDFEFIGPPTLQTSHTLRVTSPTESEHRRERLMGENNKVAEIFGDQRLHSLSPTNEQIPRIRGTFQRELVTNEEKTKILEQKRIMKEVLDLQIEEKKRKQQQFKELERERAKLDEERIKKEIEDELRLQNDQKLKKAIETMKIQSHPSSAMNQLKRSISKDSFRSGGQLQINRDDNLDNSKDNQVQLKMKQTGSTTIANQPDQLPNLVSDYIQSAQGFYLQSEYISFLKQQNDDLKAENDKKDQLIQGLIGTKPKINITRGSVGNINQFHNIIKKSITNADQITNINQINPSSPSMMTSISATHLTKSQSSKYIKGVPKSQQEKKIHYQRLPQITTPQPQLSHLKNNNVYNEDNIMDQLLASNQKYISQFYKTIRVDKETFLSRTKQFLVKEEEQNWSFGKADQLLLPSVQSHKEFSTFSKKRPHIQPQSLEIAQITKLQNELQPKVNPLESFMPSHAIKKHLNIPRPPQILIQYQIGELPGQSTFLKSENNHVNPEFTFSNSISDQLIDHNYSSFGSSKKAKDKLPKEFQIVPLKRKFFI